MDHQLLKWDTDSFGYKTGQIIPENLSRTQLKTILTEMRDEKFQLVYWASEQQPEYDIQPLSGLLVDKKITYATAIKDDIFPMNKQLSIAIPFQKSYSFDQLEQLAIQSGIYSRFNVDPRFPHEKFIHLYKEWIRKSVSHELADEILVTLSKDKITGMVTPAIKNGTGSIGLIAVEKNFRGQKLGQHLIYSALGWFFRHGCQRAEVVTQGNNLPACRLYEKCGFHVEKTAYFYHFWL